MIGDHSVENFCAALALAESVCKEPIAAETAEKISQIPGRLEKVSNTKDRVIIVDYAHTPDALDKSLSAIRGLSNEAIWVVFGCGGDRDKGKRAQMGAIAEKNASRIVITSDNPRTEDPASIVTDILVGLNTPEKAVKLLDRRAAIEYAIESAEPNDIILIAGKGHEDYQIIGSEKLPFDDRKIVLEVLNA